MTQSSLKVLDRQSTAPSENRLVRSVAFTLIGGATIMALYLGQEILLPTAVAILIAFILTPATRKLRRYLPISLSVAITVIAAVAVIGVLTVLVMSQLADVAGRLTLYQTNLQQKIKDIHDLSGGGGPLSRFMSMVASLTNDFATEGSKVEPAVRVQSGASNFSTVAAFVLPLLHPLLTIGIVMILVVFILLDRDHISDQVVRLFGGSNVHATSEALEDAARRVAKVLSLQVLTNFGFSIAVGGGLFFLGTPNAILWGLLAGALRFVPYVGAALGAVLPTLIAFAVSPGWVQPLLVLGWIVGCDIFLGQIIEPLIFGDSTGVTPLALILSALFWGALWGPVGLLLSTPITICLLVLGRHVPNLGFLHILLGDEPALKPYQQIYRRLMRLSVPEACTVALAEIEEKGPDLGLEDSIGRMVVLAETDRAADRLSPSQIDAVVDGTDLVLDFLEDLPDDAEESVDGKEATPARPRPFINCIGGRGQIDDAAALAIAFGLRRAGLNAAGTRHAGGVKAPQATSLVVNLLCYASHPSTAVRRYTARKLRALGKGTERHAIIDYDVAATHPTSSVGLDGTDTIVGDIATICRSVTGISATIASLDDLLEQQSKT
jgi:predicted PurR-regulated permease PerM